MTLSTGSEVVETFQLFLAIVEAIPRDSSVPVTRDSSTGARDFELSQ